MTVHKIAVDFSRLTKLIHGPHIRRGVMSVGNIMEKDAWIFMIF